MAGVTILALISYFIMPESAWLPRDRITHFIDSKGAVEENYISDSYLRVADCFFMTKGYFQAIDFSAPLTPQPTVRVVKSAAFRSISFKNRLWDEF